MCELLIFCELYQDINKWSRAVKCVFVLQFHILLEVLCPIFSLQWLHYRKNPVFQRCIYHYQFHLDPISRYIYVKNYVKFSSLFSLLQISGTLLGRRDSRLFMPPTTTRPMPPSSYLMALGRFVVIPGSHTNFSISCLQ